MKKMHQLNVCVPLKPLCGRAGFTKDDATKLVSGSIELLTDRLYKETDFPEQISHLQNGLSYELNKIADNDLPGVEFKIRILIQPSPDERMMRVDLIYTPDKEIDQTMKDIKNGIYKITIE
jgi:hypothetical protein